jgi:hypothetical protein
MIDYVKRLEYEYPITRKGEKLSANGDDTEIRNETNDPILDWGRAAQWLQGKEVS